MQCVPAGFALADGTAEPAGRSAHARVNLHTLRLKTRRIGCVIPRVHAT